MSNVSFTELIASVVLDGSVHVGEDKTKRYVKHHLVVLSSEQGQDGVTVHAAVDGVRGVLVAGAPLDQGIVQVSTLKLSLTSADLANRSMGRL